MSNADPLLFIGGCPRSGTTLVRNLVAAHPLVAIPGESPFVLNVLRELLATGQVVDLERAWQLVRAHHSYRNWGLEPAWVAAEVKNSPPRDYPDLVRSLFAAFARSRSKELAADKTPNHAKFFPLLSSLFPDSRMVNVIRDPRAVVMSGSVQWFTRAGIALFAVVWRNHVKSARLAAATLGHEKFQEVRYERLMADSTTELERLCAFGGIPFDPGMISAAPEHAPPERAFSSSRLPIGAVERRWRDEMSMHEIAVIESLAGEEIERAGYPLVSNRRARAIAGAEIARFRAANRVRYRIRDRWFPALPPLPERLPAMPDPVTPLSIDDIEPQQVAQSN